MCGIVFVHASIYGPLKELLARCSQDSTFQRVLCIEGIQNRDYDESLLEAVYLKNFPSCRHPKKVMQNFSDDVLISGANCSIV